jgi:glycine cleavage system aminomethyltransferase T
LAARYGTRGLAAGSGPRLYLRFQQGGGFVGREALLAQREAGAPKRRLVQFLLEDPEPLVYHNEPIYRDG